MGKSVFFTIIFTISFLFGACSKSNTNFNKSSNFSDLTMTSKSVSSSTNTGTGTGTGTSTNTSTSTNTNTGTNTSWSLPTSPIPSSSAFYALLSGMDSQTQESYRVLYHWLAHYSLSDFDIPKTEITYNTNFFTSDENTFKFRTLASNSGRNIIGDNGKILQVSSNAFLLSTIDANGQILIQRDSNYMFLEPIAGAWLYLWDYPGNPYYQSTNLINRSFSYAIPAMIWLDNQHHKGLYQRTDFIGGSLLRYALPYSAAKSTLPAVVRQAYEYILIKMFNRANTWSLNTTFGDMNVQTAVGMYYVAKALGNADYYTTASVRAKYIYDTLVNTAGFEKHENGADLLYNHIAQYFTAWLLSATQVDTMAASLYSWLTPFMDRSCKFTNYLTYLDPVTTAKRNYINPSHFNAANGGGMNSVFWNSGFKSYLAGGMYSNQCRTLLNNQPADSYQQYPLTDSPSTMRTSIQSFLSSSSYSNSLTNDCNGSGGNNRWSVRCTSTDMPTAPVAENHWTNDTSFQFNYLYYKSGYYSSLMSDITNNAQWNNSLQILLNSYKTQQLPMILKRHGL